MEVILESAEGVPPGAVLSIKVGDVKRQAPVSKLGQPFRFASSPADPAPLKVELLTLAAEPQMVKLQPGVKRFVVDFSGGARVTLVHQAAPQLQRPPVDIGEAAEKGGLSVDKMQLAQSAAQYLEQHDLVHTFQDLLHGLLVSKPDDPMAFVEEKLARQRELAGGKAAPRPPNKGVESFNGPQSEVAQRRKRPSKGDASLRGSVASVGKVDSLLMTLQMTHDNMDMVLPFLPEDLRDMLVSSELAEECRMQFKTLDVRGQGKLVPADLVPLLVHLTTARATSIPADQCQKLVAMFDSDDDGFISIDEFTTLLQFVIITAYLESADGRATLQLAKVEDNQYNDFMRMIEDDMEKLWSIIPFLPGWLEEHLTSEAFLNECLAQFAELDKDKSGSLEPMELVPVIQNMCKAHPLTISYEKCKKFVKLFDQRGNGVIMQDEFVEFSQYISVMSFLSSSEGQQISAQADFLSRGKRFQDQAKKLLEAPGKLSDVISTLPKMLHDDLMSSGFEMRCADGYDVVDKTGTGTVSDQALLPMVAKLSEAYPFYFDMAACRQYYTCFSEGMPNPAVMDKKQLISFARYSLCLAFLEFSRDNQDLLVADILMGKDKVKDLLETLKENAAQIGDFVPFLPDGFKNELLSDQFEAQCMEDFNQLDEDRSGVLEPKELMPVIMDLTQAHSLAMTEDDARQFVNIFDSERNGVITKAEYVNFTRFMMIMAYLATDEGSQVLQDVGNAKSGLQIEDWLQMVESDRNAVQKIISLLPKHVFDHITSDEFVQNCAERFTQLDKDKTGVLRPHELVPLVVDLTGAYASTVTAEHGVRFTKIFDIHGDGVLRPDEFLDFLRFLTIMGYLQSPEGQANSKDCLAIMDDSKRIEDLLSTLESDRRQIQTVLPYLPSWLHDEVLSSHFTQNCMETFKELDKDNSGTLEPEELYPLILAMADSHNLALDMSQCKRFTAIFDDAGDEVIRKGEFVNFCRFQMVMSYLQSQEGQKILGTVQRDQEARILAPVSDEKRSTDLAIVRQSGPPPPVQDYQLASPRSAAAVPAEIGHLVVDVECYQKKSEKLKAENETLRGRMQSLEDLVRMMEQKMEDQDMRLRHAEVDLQAVGTPRYQ